MIHKIEEYLNSPNVKSLAVLTQESYRQALVSKFHRYCVKYLRHRRPPAPEDMTVEMLDMFVRSIKRSGFAGTSIRQYITIIKLFYRFYDISIEYAYRIPSDERRAVNLKRMKRWFVEDEIERILNYRHTDLRNEIMVRLLIETGMRVQELSDIQAGDIVTADRTMWVKKSKTQPRPVFYSATTNVCIMQYMSRDELFGDFIKKRKRLFPSSYQIKTIVNDMLFDLKIKTPKDGRGPHTFRHWCATYLYYNGNMLLVDIGRLLGDTPGVIEKHYLHPTPAMLRRRADTAMGWDN